MDGIITTIVFILSAGYVLLLDILSSSPRSLQKALILPICILAFAVYRFSKTPLKKLIQNYEILFFLFWAIIFVQLLIIGTGGLLSPFFILIHITMLGLCFVFGFSVAFSFLIFSLAVIFIDISFHQNIAAFFIHDIYSTVLQLISLIAIIPLTYLVSRNYKLKDWLLSMLRTKVSTDEAIFERLDELIIVTDAKLHILSVNDAVERAIQRSRSELLHAPIFDVLLLKNNKGTLVTKETFFSNGDTNKKPIKNTNNFMLVKTSLSQKEVSIQVQTIQDKESKMKQITFILSFTQKPMTQTSSIAIEKTRTKYEAMNESLKKHTDGDVRSQIIMLEKIESDMYNAQLLKKYADTNTASRIDVAKLCKQTVLLEQEFAKAYNVSLTFRIENFGMKDIKPLVTKNFHAAPEDFTGPFFTVEYNIKLLDLVIKKLIDISILLSSTQTKPAIQVTMDRGNKDTIIINITASSPVLSQKSLHDLFVPYYGKLDEKTNLDQGSGLEGYVVKTAKDLLGIPLGIQYKNKNITFTLSLKKNPKLVTPR